MCWTSLLYHKSMNRLDKWYHLIQHFLMSSNYHFCVVQSHSTVTILHPNNNKTQKTRFMGLLWRRKFPYSAIKWNAMFLAWRVWVWVAVMVLIAPAYSICEAKSALVFLPTVNTHQHNQDLWCQHTQILPLLNTQITIVTNNTHCCQHSCKVRFVPW